MLIDKEICNDPKNIANKFNENFASVGDKIQENIFNAGIGVENYLENMNEHSFFLKPTDKKA